MKSWSSVAQLAKDVNERRAKASDLVEQALNNIEAGKEFKAVIATTTKRARQRAKEIDESIAKGERAGRLAGVPFIAKDNFLAYGSDTTAASNILKGFDAPYQATTIEKLEAEGAICVAKANLDAFGHGASTENSDFFTTHNPHDKTRVPGGSSGGSAAAVVLDLVPFAIGTDTGGSIRQPASLSGCVGYKPTYGLVSRSGVIAMASSTDTIGPLTKTVQDAALVLDVMAGQDPLDGTTVKPNPKGYQVADNKSLKGAKVGVISEYYQGIGLEDGVKNKINQAITKLEKAGTHVSSADLPSLPLSLAVYYIICPAEISSNLSRYDGQKYGYYDKSAHDLKDSYLKARSIGFGAEAKRRIMVGTYVLSSGYYDAYYKRAQTVRTKLINEFENAFEQFDFLVGPTAPTTAFKIGENTNPLQMYMQDIMTVAPSLVGIPAISIPAGEVAGLPVGLQIMAAQGKDRELLEIAAAAERILS